MNREAERDAGLRGRMRRIVRGSAFLSMAVRRVRELVSLSRGTWLAARALRNLMASRRVIADAEVLVMIVEGGFGHTVAAPDVARRLFPQSRITFVMLSGPGRFNRCTSDIWPAPMSIVFLETEQKPFWQRRMPVVARRCCERWLHPGARRIWSVVDLYRELDALRPAETAGFPERLNIAWTAAYFRLIDSTSAPPPALPAAVAARVMERLSLSPDRRIAALYLRQKDGGDVTSATRSGSSIEAYEPAIRALVDAGHVVLLTGDVQLGRTGARWAGVIDREAAARAGVPDDLFQIFAVLRADLCISEAGGGAWLPMIAGKPHLCLNAYPFFFAMRGAWMHPKRLVDETGREVPAARMFDEFLFVHQPPAGYRLVNNEAREIGAAIGEFLANLRSGRRPDAMSAGPAAGRGWYPSAHAALCGTWMHRQTDGEST